ncbi:MAG: BadF/BadG/BcrA/BcrD ATPase family protein [Smithella sp.]|jgi:predicted CoA-substrate-specific enzyme activase
MISAGIDIGSITAKAALFAEKKIIATKVIFTGYNAEAAGLKVYEEVLKEAGIDKSAVKKIVSTGYGRNSVKFADKSYTEIMCHAAGAHFLNPHIRSIIDIGGQDSKAILLDDNGKVKNFVMNDKCAAGTGRFLEVMARAMEVSLDEFGTMSIKSKNPSKISSLCTVFAESEVISLIAKGEQRQDIIAGIHESIASRISSMVGRVGIKEPVMITGGVARNIGVIHALEKKLGMNIEVSPYAQVNGAIGAAIIATSL